MDRLVAYDFGPKINPVTPGTEGMARQAEVSLVEFLEKAAGTDFYGETSLRIVWAAGQIKLVAPRVEQTAKPDA